MNDLLRKLAEQAREYANSSQPYEKIKNKAWIDVYDEKFAELIVKECIDIVVEYSEDGAYCQRQMIKERFGVE